MPEVGEWRIHLGAHKTATTHLQETLSVMPEALGALGLVYLETFAARPILAGLGARGPRRWIEGPEPLGRRVGARLAARALAGAGPGRPGVAVSDENLLGPLVDVLRRRPYPGLARRVAPLAALGGGPVTLFLGIRPFDRVRAGAYATALRYGRLSPFVLRRREAIFGRPPPRWSEIVDRIARAAPGARLRVWRHEDYAADPAGVIGAFLGHGVAIPWREPPRATLTPSAEGVAAVERLIREGAPRRDGRAWVARVNALYAAHPAAAGTPFRPHGAESEARHRAAYEADLAAIRRDRPGCLIEP